MKKILFIDNTAHHLYTQSHLYDHFRQRGYQVYLCCPDDKNYFQKMHAAGYECYNLAIDAKGLNPFLELSLLYRLRKLFKLLHPDIILSFTIKPNLYSALLGRFLKIPTVPNITGMGYVFIGGGFLKRLIISLYKIAFRKLPYIIFQNKDDIALFKQHQILSSNTQIVLVPGSGVNLEKFHLKEMAERKLPITFLYSGRLLWDKGIGELIAAFRIVKNTYPSTQLKFIGNYYPGNPAAISQKQIEAWIIDPGVEYLGMVDNVPHVLQGGDCVVLPSYREGTPRSVLEASSVGLGVITADVPGCAYTVDDGATGFLCKVKDSIDLAGKMIKFIELSPDRKRQMGLAGRKKMEREFDQNIVINEYMSIITTVVSLSKITVEIN